MYAPIPQAAATEPTPFGASTLTELAKWEGTCLSLLIPGSSAGAAPTNSASLLHSAVDLVPARVGTENFVRPLEDFAEQFGNSDEHSGLALFRSPGHFAAISAPSVSEDLVVCGDYCFLSPLVTVASMPQEFYVLLLNHRPCRFFRYFHGRCEQVEIPAGLPQGPEVRHTFRVAQQSWAGHENGASEHNPTREEYLVQYYRTLDRGLRGLLQATPVLLAGSREDVSSFRRESRNLQLLDTEIEGNVEELALDDLAGLAAEASLLHYRRLGQAVLAKHRYMTERRRALSDAGEIITAAKRSRVYQLCALEPGDAGGGRNGGPRREHDMVNRAIVETLSHGGQVFMLTEAAMPPGSPLAAILKR